MGFHWQEEDMWQPSATCRALGDRAFPVHFAASPESAFSTGNSQQGYLQVYKLTFQQIKGEWFRGITLRKIDNLNQNADLIFYHYK